MIALFPIFLIFLLFPFIIHHVMFKYAPASYIVVLFTSLFNSLIIGNTSSNAIKRSFQVTWFFQCLSVVSHFSIAFPYLMQIKFFIHFYLSLITSSQSFLSILSSIPTTLTIPSSLNGPLTLTVTTTSILKCHLFFLSFPVNFNELFLLLPSLFVLCETFL
jgi:hypothetical protein